MSELPPLAADRVLTVQALFAGQVTDQATGRPITRGLTVDLRNAADGRPLPGLTQRLLPEEGRFVYAGDPRAVLAALATAPLTLRVVASAPGYATVTLPLNLAIADGSVLEVTLRRPYGDVKVGEWVWKDALAPHPLRLAVAL
jgi:hypothetical protein